jgi:hypothetical protein
VLYDSAIAHAPDYAEANNYRGYAFPQRQESCPPGCVNDLKRQGDALASFNVAGALWPDHARAHWTA